MARVEESQRSIVQEISEQILQSLEVLSIPLPNGPMRPMQTTRARRNLLIGTLDFEVPVEIEMRYQYVGTHKMPSGRQCAYFYLTGKIRGRRGDGTNVGGKVEGKAEVLTKTGEVYIASADIRVDMDIPISRGGSIQTGGVLKVKLHPTSDADRK